MSLPRPKLPAGFLLRQVGPPAPPPRVAPPFDVPPSTGPTDPALGNLPTLLPLTAYAASTSPQNLLDTEADEVRSVVASIVQQMPVGSTFNTLGQTLQDTLQNLPSQTIAVMVQVVDDFRTNATDVLDAGVPDAQVSPASNLDPLISKFLNFAGGLAAQELRHLADGLQNHLTQTQTAHIKNQTQRDLVEKDLQTGYGYALKNLTSYSSQIAGGTPLGWADLASQSSTAGIPEVTNALSSSYTEVLNGFKEWSAQALSIHMVLHGDVQVQANHSENIQKTSALLTGALAGLSALENQQSLPDPQTMSNLMRTAAKNIANQELKRLQKRLQHKTSSPPVKPTEDTQESGDVSDDSTLDDYLDNYA